MLEHRPTSREASRAVGPGGPLHAGQAALEAHHVYSADRPATYGLSVHVARVELDPRQVL